MDILTSPMQLGDSSDKPQAAAAPASHSLCLPAPSIRLRREQRQGNGKVSGLVAARSAREGDRQSASCARREFTRPMCSPAGLHLPAVPSVMCLLALRHRRCPTPWPRRACIRRAVAVAVPPRSQSFLASLMKKTKFLKIGCMTPPGDDAGPCGGGEGDRGAHGLTHHITPCMNIGNDIGHCVNDIVVFQTMN